MRYVFSLRTCLNRWVDTRAPAFIHYFKHSRGKTMFSHDQMLLNPKSYGLVHDVCVKKICCTVFADALI